MHAGRHEASRARRGCPARVGHRRRARAQLRPAVGQPSPRATRGGNRHEADPAGRPRHPAHRRRPATRRARGRSHRPPRRRRERTRRLQRPARGAAPAGGVPVGAVHDRAGRRGDTARQASQRRSPPHRGRAARGAAYAASGVRGRGARVPARAGGRASPALPPRPAGFGRPRPCSRRGRAPAARRPGPARAGAPGRAGARDRARRRPGRRRDGARRRDHRDVARRPGPVLWPALDRGLRPVP